MTSPTTERRGALPLPCAPGDLQASLLAHPRSSEATRAWVRALADSDVHEHVALGLLVRGHLRVVADTAAVGAASNRERTDRLTQAMAEALDQSTSVAYPDSRANTQPRITLAHRRLLDGRGGSVASVPVVAAGRVIGAVCVESAGLLAAPDLERLEGHARAAAPVLALMRSNERSLAEHVRDRLLALWSGPRRSSVRFAAGAAAAGLALLTLLPLDWHVSGHARLEGTVQRLLVAPADGFLRQVHARPGEQVKRGQVLAELADQDLLLEQQRWQSQMQQHENAYAAANAQADRAAQVIHQARSAEAEAQLELVGMKLARARIEAPFDGIVVEGDLSQQLGAPLAEGAGLMTIAPLHQFRVMVEIDERDIAAIAPGQGGTLALSALPWDTLPIRVTRISPIASVSDGRNVFAVEARLLDAATTLRPGLQGSARILAGERSWLGAHSRRLVEALRLGLWSWWG